MVTWKEITFERFATMENLKTAHMLASKGKRSRISVTSMGEEKAQKALLKELLEGTYRPRPQKKMIKFDKNAKKQRQISCPAFRDQIVHWMVVEFLRDRYMQHFIKHSVANIPGRGVSYGKNLLRHWSQQRGTKWVLQLDIKKYYHNIDVDILIEKYKKHIRDKKFMSLIKTILYHDTNDEHKGITLGSYFNQWCALFYLSDFDHFVKEHLQVNFYLRYVDDMLLLFNSKRNAKKAFDAIESELLKIGLTPKKEGSGKYKIFAWKGNFIDMLGYRTHRNGKQDLRRKNYIMTRRLCDEIDRGYINPGNARSILSRKGFFEHSDCRRMFSRIQNTIYEKNLKEVAKCG